MTLELWKSGRLPLDQVQTTRRLNYAADSTLLERKSSLLELLLHISLAKVSQVAALARRRAI